MRINFDFADLEAFLAVKSTGSFHQAAERLSLSQSAVTRRVQKLEEALDSLLFERSTRHVKPTLAAKRLQARAEAILEDARETSRAMRDDSVAFEHQRSFVVTLATLPTVVADLIPAAIRRYRSAGQAARIRLLDMATNEVAEAVAQGDADFGLCAIPTLEPDTEFEPLFDDRMVLAMPDDHPRASQDRVAWQSLRAEALILPARGTGNRLLIDEAVARAGGALSWTFETQRTATALALVSGGAGVALLPLSALQSKRDPRVVWRPLDDPVVARPVGLLTRAGQADRPEVDALKDAIRSVA